MLRPHEGPGNPARSARNTILMELPTETLRDPRPHGWRQATGTSATNVLATPGETRSGPAAALITPASRDASQAGITVSVVLMTDNAPMVFRDGLVDPLP